MEAKEKTNTQHDQIYPNIANLDASMQHLLQHLICTKTSSLVLISLWYYCSLNPWRETRWKERGIHDWKLHVWCQSWRPALQCRCLGENFNWHKVIQPNLTNSYFSTAGLGSAGDSKHNVACPDLVRVVKPRFSRSKRHPPAKTEMPMLP